MQQRYCAADRLGLGDELDIPGKRVGRSGLLEAHNLKSCRELNIEVWHWYSQDNFRTAAVLIKIHVYNKDADVVSSVDPLSTFSSLQIQPILA